jgi:hypothetical protein
MDKKSPKYPILAHPRLTVEVGTETSQVEATLAEEHERTRLYITPTVENCAFLLAKKAQFSTDLGTTKWLR